MRHFREIEPFIVMLMGKVWMDYMREGLLYLSGGISNLTKPIHNAFLMKCIHHAKYTLQIVTMIAYNI